MRAKQSFFPTLTPDLQFPADLASLSRFEWLEANGIGGWASSTISGANTRKYHGVLVVGTLPASGRVVLLSKLEETLLIAGERTELSTNYYPGVEHPKGYSYITNFEVNPFPITEFTGPGFKLRKTVAAIHGKNLTAILYELVESSGAIELELRPFVAGRDYHETTTLNPAIAQAYTFTKGELCYSPYPRIPPLHLLVPGSQFTHDPLWNQNFEYPVERDRGYDFQEDLFSPGRLTVTLKPGALVGVIAAGEPITSSDARGLIKREEIRRKALIVQSGAQTRLEQQLVLASDSFIISRSKNSRTILAGYHWFGEWGRDAFIALPGVCLVTRRFDDARAVLRTFLERINEGMIPNRIDDAGNPEFNSVDASLWAFVASYEYVVASRDEKFILHEALPVLERLFAAYQSGTRFRIRADGDGLLTAGDASTQLTWMDARYGGIVVTPRHGKAVEINALWYNAAKILALFQAKHGSEEAARALEETASNIQREFVTKFWLPHEAYLADCINEHGIDSSLRPNQLFALSLPFPVVDGPVASAVLTTVERHLLTPRGLRTLDSRSAQFKAKYEGDQATRDFAYHQGTVWPYLIGVYARACMRFGSPIQQDQLRGIMLGFSHALREYGIGSVAEIYDATAPYTPRGCISQAWSVGEVLVALSLVKDMQKKDLYSNAGL